MKRLVKDCVLSTLASPGQNPRGGGATMARLRPGTEIVAGTAALLELIKASVELWRCLPFGPAPTPRAAFRQLEKEIFPGPRWPRMLKTIIAFNKTHEAMDWDTLLSIYHQARRSDEEARTADLSEHFVTWLEARPEAYQDLLDVLLEENIRKSK